MVWHHTSNVKQGRFEPDNPLTLSFSITVVQVILVHLVGVRIPEGQLKFLFMYLTFHIICIFYCFYQLIKKYRKHSNPGMIGVSPGLDAIMVVILAPALAVVDLSLTWIRMYKEAEEARRRGNDKQIL